MPKLSKFQIFAKGSLPERQKQRKHLFTQDGIKQPINFLFAKISLASIKSSYLFIFKTKKQV